MIFYGTRWPLNVQLRKDLSKRNNKKYSKEQRELVNKLYYYCFTTPDQWDKRVWKCTK